MAMAEKTSLQKWICILSIFIAMLPVIWLFELAHFVLNLGKPFCGWIPKNHIQCQKKLRSKILSFLVYLLHKMGNETFSYPGKSCSDSKQMYQKDLVWCMCRVFVLLINLLLFWTFSLLSELWHLKLPKITCKH